MKKNILLLLGTLWFSSFPPLLTADKTLEEAVASGIKKNAGVQNRVLDEKSSLLHKERAEKDKLFSLILGGAYRYQSDRMEISFDEISPAPGITIPGRNITAGTYHNFDIKLGLTQPLFTGFVLKNMAASEEVRTVIARNRTFRQRLEIANLIKTSYFRYRLLLNEKDTLSALLKKLEIHHQKLLAFYEENLAGRSDILETETRVQEQKLALSDLESAIDKEKIHFIKLCGLDIEQVEEHFQEKSVTYEEALSFFQNRHPVLKNFEEQIRLIDIQKRIIQGRYLPLVAGFAEVHFGKPGLDIFRNEWAPYFIGGISVDFKLFDGSKKKIDLEVLANTQKKFENSRSDFLQEGEKNLKQLFEQKKSAEHQIHIIDRLLDLAREDNRIKRDLVREDQISNRDYLASLTAEKGYASRRNTMLCRLELIKVHINTLAGIYKEET